MADLGKTMATIHSEVQAVWGWADDDAGEQAEALQHMNNAWLRIVNAVSPEDSIPHLWTWLRKIDTITLADGTNTYALAVDFAGIFHGEVPYYASVSSEDFPTMKEISLHKWQELQEPESADEETEPEYYCVRALETFTPSVGQRWELCVWHTPDETRTLYVPYRRLVVALTDAANYAPGGPNIAQLIYYGALSEMEKKDGTGPNGPWETAFQQRLKEAIDTDSSYYDYTVPDQNQLEGLGVWGWGL